MPAPLAMPLMVTGTPSISACARGELGIGVGGHDGARRIADPVRLGSLGKPGQEASEFARVERLADHPGRGEIDVCLEAIGGFGGGFRRELHRFAATLAGEGIGIAGIDHQRARHAMLKPRAAPFDRGRRGLRPREHAGDRGARLEQRKQQIGAAGIADTRRASREAHPVNGGKARQLFRREWRDLGHLGSRPSSGDRL